MAGRHSIENCVYGDGSRPRVIRFNCLTTTLLDTNSFLLNSYFRLKFIEFVSFHKMIEEILSTLLRHWPTAILILTIAYLAKNRYHNGLQKYPGPVLASLTDWWRFFDVLGRRPDITHIDLHRKHGDIIRYGPNALSFANPQALKTIYGLNKGFIKVSIRNDHDACVAAETL